MEDRESWHAMIHVVVKSWPRLSDRWLASWLKTSTCGSWVAYQICLNLLNFFVALKWKIYIAFEGGVGRGKKITVDSPALSLVMYVACPLLFSRTIILSLIVFCFTECGN